MSVLRVGRLEGVVEVALSAYRRAGTLLGSDPRITSEAHAHKASGVRNRWGLLQEQLRKDVQVDPGLQVAPCLVYALHSARMVHQARTTWMVRDAEESARYYWDAARSWLQEAARRRRLNTVGCSARSSG